MAETVQYPGVYKITQIFDPDTNPNGPIIPAIDSIIIDHENDGRLYYVKAIDPITNKPTLEYTKTSLATLDDSILDYNITSIINYGNTRFYMYFNSNNQPTKITIDKKLIIFGKNNKYYRLIKHDINNPEKYDVISSNYSPSGDYLGEYIPLVDADNNGYVKYCQDCYTSFSIDNNELITFEVYDINKNLTYTITLFAKSINSILFTEEPRKIIGFELESTQEIDNNTFYIYPQQNVNSLVLTPKLILNDGQILPVKIDNSKCFLYGLDDFQPSFPGQETKLICKYYLSQNEIADPNIVIDNMLVLEKTLRVVNDTSDTYKLKISVIPRYDVVNSKYVLYFYMYTMGSNVVRDITPLIHVLTQNFNYRTDNTGTFQLLEFKLNLKDVFPSLAEEEYHLQSCLIKLNASIFRVDIDRYTIKDSQNDEFIYGVTGGNRQHPIIYCNMNTEEYFISSNLFTSKTMFLNEFYYQARPLYDASSNEITPPEPTHFTIRDIITNNLLLSEPINVDQYTNSFNLLTSAPIVNTNVIVEMLQKQSDGSYLPLYGVPVDILPIN